MRIGMVSPYSFDVPGGVQLHIRDLAEKYRGSREFDLRGETRVIVRFTPDRIGGNV